MRVRVRVLCPRSRKVPLGRGAGTWCLLFGRLSLVLPLSLLSFVVFDLCGSAAGKLTSFVCEGAKVINACGGLVQDSTSHCGEDSCQGWQHSAE